MVESLAGGFAGGDYRKRCLCVKAACAGSVKFRAIKAFAAMAAIPAAVVWLWGEWWEWWWQWWW